MVTKSLITFVVHESFLLQFTRWLVKLESFDKLLLSFINQRLLCQNNVVADLLSRYIAGTYFIILDLIIGFGNYYYVEET